MAAQIQTSSSCSCESIKDFGNLFLGLEYFAQRFNQPVDESGKKYLTDFSTPEERFWPKNGVIGVIKGDLLGSNVPLALLIDP